MLSRQLYFPGVRYMVILLTVVMLLNACSSVTTSSGSSSGGTGKKNLKFAYLAKHLDNPYFVNESAGAKSKAKQLGVNLTVQDLQFDANLALSSMDTVIGTGTKGIIMVVPQQKIGPAVIAKANAANVPLISVDDPIIGSDGKAAPFVGFSSPDIGKQVGDEIATLYRNAGWASDASKSVRAVSLEYKTLDVCNQRTDASTAELLKQVPQFGAQNILHVPYDATLNGAISSMSTIITANPRVTNWLIWSCNDGGVLGAVRALENAGVSADRTIGVGLGGEMACNEWNKGKPTGFKAAAYTNSGLNGQIAVQLMYDHVVNNKPIPDRTIVGSIVATPDNYKKVISGCQ